MESDATARVGDSVFNHSFALSKPPEASVRGRARDGFHAEPHAKRVELNHRIERVDPATNVPRSGMLKSGENVAVNQAIIRRVRSEVARQAR